MEETSTFTEPIASPEVTDTSGVGTGSMMSTGSYGYTDPISSFFGGIFFIIIFFLVIVFVIVLMIGRGLGIFKDAPASPPAEVKKEKFADGPPYPSCKTNGAFAMF